MDGIEKVEKPVSPIMPLMGNLVANAMPVPVPQMQWEAGIIPNFFHNIKLGQIAKASEREASIAECKSRAVKANTEAIFNIVTLSARIEDQFDLFGHNKEMRKVELQTSQALLIEQQLKNQVLHGEVLLNDIEVKIKMKQLEDMLGGANAEH